jgi:uncharacterized protein (UPF0248 family)
MADESTGISRGGKEAEEQFMAITGATPTARAALGDAVLVGVTVEIKHTKKTEALNQVRAVKYIPLVVWVSGEDAWYVIPAHRIVAIVSGRKRGQHTENPFESATLNLKHLGDYRLESAADLATAVARSAAESTAYPQLKNEMDRVLAEAKEHAAEDIERVTRVLVHLDLL